MFKGGNNLLPELTEVIDGKEREPEEDRDWACWMI